MEGQTNLAYQLGGAGPSQLRRSSGGNNDGRGDLRLDVNRIEEKLAQLGVGKPMAFSGNDFYDWMGPDSWKNKMPRKVAQNGTAGEATEKKAGGKKRVEVKVDFSQQKRVPRDDIFGPTRGKKGEQKESQRQRNGPLIHREIAPVDFHIDTRHLKQLFMRAVIIRDGTADAATDINVMNDQDKIVYQDNNFFFVQDGIQRANTGGLAGSRGLIGGDYDGLGDQDDLGGGAGGELLDIDANVFVPLKNQLLEDGVGKDANGSGNTAKSMNIRELKEKMMDLLKNLPVRRRFGNKKPNQTRGQHRNDEGDEDDEADEIELEPEELEAGETIKFSSLCGKVRDIANIRRKKTSVQSCFVTMLHLANEKNLRFASLEGEDFCVYKEV
jgi:hypothetical protein